MAPTKQSATKRKHNAEDTPTTSAKRIRSSFASGLKVHVGPEKEPFFVHEDVICASSAFFEAACSKTWKENQEKTVDLPTADPAVFRNYVYWVYNGEMDEDGFQKCEWKLDTDNEAKKRGMTLIHNLCKLWVLADYLQDADCKTSVMSMLLNQGSGAHTNVMIGTMSLVVAETADTSALFRWLLDRTVHRFNVNVVHKFPPSLQLALLKRLGTLRDSGGRTRTPGPSDLDKYVDDA